MQATECALDRIVEDGPNEVVLRKLGEGHWLARRNVAWFGYGSFSGRGTTPGEAIAALDEAVAKDRAACAAEEDLVPALEASLAAVRAR